ncbi:MAG: tyrosine-type recombinase/integrase [Gemmatimonadetes bacterium]|nr:tyrosine-type recombinase/integrase [Gemmatimonadota bacterium]MBI2538073.1 tyrosine-type recombinase/integrase [Gemmatimonadota bacterium]
MLANAIARYTDLNRALGMRFQVDEAMLKAFHRHAGEVDLAAISPEVVVAFLQPRHRVTSTWLMKHRALRRFYQHAITRGLVARSPVPTAVPRVTETFVPHIYSLEELQRLLGAVEAHQARPRCTIAAPTLRAVLLLLYGTGLRVGEALALRREDVDLRAGMILIREAKFYKSRHLPIGPRLTRVLTGYLDTVPAVRGRGLTACFVNLAGRPLPHYTLRHTFTSLCARVGVRGRLHDLRHTFAVHRLLAWYREGADVQRCLPQLSTYLGHARLACTQRYLTMTPELLDQASRRFETYAHVEVSHD